MKKGKRVLGIDIGTFSTKIVEGAYTDKLRVYRYGIFPTLKVMREQNTITNIHEYTSGLKRTLKRNRFRAKDCYVSFSGDDIIIRKMRLPRMNEDQIRKNLEVELREYLPVKVDHYIVDFRILRRDIEDPENAEEGHGYELMVVAMLKEVAFQYISMLRRAGLKPRAIDLAVNSQGKLMRVLLGKDEFEKNVLGFVDIGQQFTGVSIYQDGIYYVSKTIAWGIGNMEGDSKGNEEHADQLAGEINRVLDFLSYAELSKTYQQAVCHRRRVPGPAHLRQYAPAIGANHILGEGIPGLRQHRRGHQEEVGPVYHIQRASPIDQGGVGLWPMTSI